MKKARRVASACHTSRLCCGRGFRGGLALTRLSALIALGFMPGLPAVGASFTDSLTFSTTGQSLWGNASSANFSAKTKVETSWGTFAGGGASTAFDFNGITELRDPLFNTYLGRYGLAASLQTSGQLGLEFSAGMRGGTLDYAQSIKPVLSLPDNIQSRTRFTVSSTDLLQAAPVLKTVMPQFNTTITGIVKFAGQLSVTGCIVSCSSSVLPIDLDPGILPLFSFDSGRYPTGNVMGYGREMVVNRQDPIYLPNHLLPTRADVQVGSFTPRDTFKDENCTISGGTVHCANQAFSGSMNVGAALAVVGVPVELNKSFEGVSINSRLLGVDLQDMSFGLALDLAVKAPVTTRLQFDKPVTEYLANGQSVLHADGVVSFALGSAVSLSFNGEVGQLVKRSYAMDDASISTQVGSDVAVTLNTQVGCGFSAKGFGINFSPVAADGCLVSTSTPISTPQGSTSLYAGQTKLNSVRASGTYQGLGNFNELRLDGTYGVTDNLVNHGAGSVTRVAAGTTAVLAGLGNGLVNSGGGKTFIEGTLVLDLSGTLENREGSELLIEPGGAIRDIGDLGLVKVLNRKATTPGLTAGLITNRGTLDATVRNAGVINNWGLYIGVTTTEGGVFNNQAGGTLRAVGGNGIIVGGGFDTINMLAGSTLQVEAFHVADGHRQVNAGTIEMPANGMSLVNGELQIGDGGTTGTLGGGRVQVFREASVLSFDRSDNTSFSSLVLGVGQLVKRNVNTLTLTADNTYTGRTLVEGGRLVLQGQTASSEIRIAANATVEISAATDRDNRSDSRFTGAGNLVKTGNGNLQWSGSRAVFALGAGARIDVLGGSFTGGSFGNEDWSLNLSGLHVASGASFSGVEANVQVNGLSGAGRISSGFAGAGYTAFTMGAGNSSASFSGVLADTDAANRHVGSYVKVGWGTQVLSGANTFTGSLRIVSGHVQIGEGGTSGSLATGLIVNNAELSFWRSDDSRFDGTIAGVGNLTKLGTGRLTLAQTPTTGFTAYTGNTSVRGGTLVLAGASSSRSHDINRAAVLELQVASGSRDGLVSTVFSGQGTLRKTGDGQSLWGASQAVFAMSAGSLIDVQAGSFVGGSSANEDWRLNQSALNVAAGASFHGVEANVRVDGLSGGGRITSGYASAGYTGFTLGVANGSGDFSGVLADSSAGNAGHFVKVGSGTQVLSGTNTHSGGTTLAGGVLSVARDANLGSGSLAFAGGTLRNTGAFVTSRQMALGAGGGGFDTAGGYLTINSNLTGPGGLVKSGVDILTLAGAQGYTGATVISAGTLKFSANGATASSVASTSIAIASGARLIFADSQTYAAAITGAGLLMHEFGGTTTLTGSASHSGGTLISGGTLQVGNGGTRGALAGDVVDNGLLAFNRSDDVVFAGTISGSGGVDQRGSGTLTLTGANTYRGATTVSAGTVQLNGSALHSAFTVGAGATLSGNAQVGTLLLAGTLAPGNSPGQISAGDTTFASGGQYLWEINDGGGLAGVDHDLLSVAGTLTVAASPGSRFTVSLRSLLGDNTPGNVIRFDAQVDHQYTLVSTSGGILGFSADEFAIDSSGFSNASFGGQWAVAVSGQDLTLNFTAAVPEPQTYALMLAGLLAVGAAARRRRPAIAASQG